MTFQHFGLLPELLSAIEDLGHTTPTPIQHKAIPVLLSGSDVIALAQTGTGKTAGFALPMLQLLNAKHDPAKTARQPRGLILAPTRELCAQIGESIRNYGKNLPLRSEIIFGGVNITPQIRKLQRGTDIIVATPGRLLDLIDQRVISLSKIEILVLDEADRMLDMGFIHDIKKILALLPKQRQNMLFSATLSSEIQALANSILREHKLLEVTNRNVTTELVTQLVYSVDQKRKRELLSYLIGFNNWLQVLVFTRTKHGANKLCEQLIEDGLTAAAIHGNKSQGARTRALQEFKDGAIRILVATDIAARGIDIEQLPHVVNYELPQVAEDYVHRIGRTGRAGIAGNAISLVCAEEAHLLADIERLTKKTIAKKVLPGYEPDKSLKAEPIFSRSNNARNTRRQPSTRNFDNSAEKGSRFGARASTGDKPNRRSFAAKTTTRAAGADNKRGNWRHDTTASRTRSEGSRSSEGFRSNDSFRSNDGNSRGNFRSDARPARTRSEGSRSGEGFRANDRFRSNDSSPRGNFRSDARPARARSEGSRSGEGFRANDRFRSTDSSPRGNFRSDERPARARSEGSRSGEGFRSNDRFRSTDSSPRGNFRSDARPARARNEGSRSSEGFRSNDSRPRGNFRSDARPAGTRSEGSRSGEGFRPNTGNSRGNFRSDARPAGTRSEGVRSRSSEGSSRGNSRSNTNSGRGRSTGFKSNKSDSNRERSW